MAIDGNVSYGSLVSRDAPTYLSASFTLVRLLSRVYALMDCEGRTLNELLSAIRVITDMRPDAAVDTFYRLSVPRQFLSQKKG